MSRRQSGQAAVESAIVLPLTVFLVLGTIQLFLMLQGRLLAQYAVARATRAGSLHSGECGAMSDAAVASLLPAIQTFITAGMGPGQIPQALANAYSLRRNGRYAGAIDGGRSEPIIWIKREHPRLADIPPDPNDRNASLNEDLFDLAEQDLPVKFRKAQTLEVRMIFWFPLRVPFANWVFAEMVMAQWGLYTLSGADPTMVYRSTANWNDGANSVPAELASFAGRVGSVLQSRNSAQHYVLPIQTTYTMRMMTPARRANFNAPFCDGGARPVGSGSLQ